MYGYDIIKLLVDALEQMQPGSISDSRAVQAKSQPKMPSVFTQELTSPGHTDAFAPLAEH